MSQKRIVVLGGGFAGLWSAAGAARKLDELGIGTDQVEVTLVNRDAFHGIRVRNYESDLSEVRVPLDDVLRPIGVRRIEAEVADFDFARQEVTLRSADGETALPYDRLVVALGSQLVRPTIPGLVEYAHDVDTYAGAARLARHLETLPKRRDDAARYSVLVVGAGLTGIETACEIGGQLREIQSRHAQSSPVRVILADRNAHIGSDMGDAARPIIERALADLGIETPTAIDVVEVRDEGARLATGERIAAATLVWCAGMRANALTAKFPVERDRFGRLPVDEFMRVRSMDNVFAAGDSAWAWMEAGHASVMSCQHGRPMGRFAGHNVVCHLLGRPMLPLAIDWYVTVLDLGPWGAVYAEGWDRRVVAVGAAAKATKQTINRQRIYPPRGGDRAAILAAAAPVVQKPPAYQA